jgi:hypothetical protein
MTSWPTSDVMSVFIPAIRRQMERDYEGVNVRFYLRQPTGIFSTIFFSPENRLPILGLAPLDFGNVRKDDRGFVFVGSFHINRGLRLAPPELLAILLRQSRQSRAGAHAGAGTQPQRGHHERPGRDQPLLGAKRKIPS